MERRDFLRGTIAAAALATQAGQLKAKSLWTDISPSALADPWLAMGEIERGILQPTFPPRDFVVTDYGAKGNNRVDCCPAFAAAIAACGHAGGGRVVIPAGTYKCNGPIHLLSNVNLYTEEGALILFGNNPLDYLPCVPIRWQGIQCYNYSPFLYAYQKTNIAVTGSGTFDGQAKLVWWTWQDLQNQAWADLQMMNDNKTPLNQRVFGTGGYLRPSLFEVFDCAKVLVQGVTFQDSPFWTIHPVFCRYVTVEGVTVNKGTSNDDGCDPDSCNWVLIDNCTFETADDNIAIKSGRGNDGWSGPPSQNIIVRNFTGVKADYGGVSIGSETSGGVRNVFVENCLIQRCESAYYIKSNSDRGGITQDIYMRSNQASDCHHFIDLDTEYGGIIGDAYPPQFTNISFENMTNTQASASGIYFVGDPRRPITNITLNGITIDSTPVPTQITNSDDLNVQNVIINGQPVSL
jgi:polygalacturonase